MGVITSKHLKIYETPQIRLFKIANQRAAHSLPSVSVGRPFTSAVPRNPTLKFPGDRGWDVHCSGSLWLPSNRKPVEVDSLICQNVLPAEMAPISSYTRRKKSAVCTTLSTVAESNPFPEPSHTTSKILEATRVAQLVLSPRGARDPHGFSALSH